MVFNYTRDVQAECLKVPWKKHLFAPATRYMPRALMKYHVPTNRNMSTAYRLHRRDSRSVIIGHYSLDVDQDIPRVRTPSATTAALPRPSKPIGVASTAKGKPEELRSVARPDLPNWKENCEIIACKKYHENMLEETGKPEDMTRKNTNYCIRENNTDADQVAEPSAETDSPIHKRNIARNKKVIFLNYSQTKQNIFASPLVCQDNKLRENETPKLKLQSVKYGNLTRYRPTPVSLAGLPYSQSLLYAPDMSIGNCRRYDVNANSICCKSKDVLESVVQSKRGNSVSFSQSSIAAVATDDTQVTFTPSPVLSRKSRASSASSTKTQILTKTNERLIYSDVNDDDADSDNEDGDDDNKEASPISQDITYNYKRPEAFFIDSDNKYSQSRKADKPKPKPIIYDFDDTDDLFNTIVQTNQYGSLMHMPQIKHQNKLQSERLKLIETKVDCRMRTRHLPSRNSTRMSRHGSWYSHVPDNQDTSGVYDYGTVSHYQMSRQQNMVLNKRKQGVRSKVGQTWKPPDGHNAYSYVKNEVAFTKASNDVLASRRLGPQMSGFTKNPTTSQNYLKRLQTNYSTKPITNTTQNSHVRTDRVPASEYTRSLKAKLLNGRAELPKSYPYQYTSHTPHNTSTRPKHQFNNSNTRASGWTGVPYSRFADIPAQNHFGSVVNYPHNKQGNSCFKSNVARVTQPVEMEPISKHFSNDLTRSVNFKRQQASPSQQSERFRSLKVTIPDPKSSRYAAIPDPKPSRYAAAKRNYYSVAPAAGSDSQHRSLGTEANKGKTIRHKDTNEQPMVRRTSNCKQQHVARHTQGAVAQATDNHTTRGLSMTSDGLIYPTYKYI